MKKIERKKVLFLNDNGEMDGHVAVLESDLDAQERYITTLEESRENTVKMLKTVLEMLDQKTCFSYASAVYHFSMSSRLQYIAWHLLQRKNNVVVRSKLR